MPCERIGNATLCSFTTCPDVTLTIEGQSYRFEFSDQFGPALLGKRGQLLQDGRAVPPSQSPFWRALRWWLAQGTRVEDGQGIYEAVPPHLTHWLRVGRHLILDTPANRVKWAAYLGPNPEIVTIAEER